MHILRPGILGHQLQRGEPGGLAPASHRPLQPRMWQAQRSLVVTGSSGCWRVA